MPAKLSLLLTKTTTMGGSKFEKFDAELTLLTAVFGAGKKDLN